MTGFIRFQRYEYDAEEWHVGITASNGAIQSYDEIYCYPTDLKNFASALKSFPSGINDEFKFEQGMEDKRSDCYLLLKIYVRDSAGHCAIQVRMNNNRDGVYEGLAAFAIKAEAASLNSLGNSLDQFATGNNRDFRIDFS